MTQRGMVRLERVAKLFGGIAAVNDVSLDVPEGQFCTLLGPSGCGKTTTLRLIAGFEQPDAGRVLIAGRDSTFLPPHRRDTAMVFQGYALFPHRNVLDNVMFGLRMRRIGSRAERRARAASALQLVGLGGFEARFPRQLSGGQQQRVALARAIVLQPSVLLLDEPLAALDLKLRRSMRYELKQLQHKTGLTTIYVTHDQEEAMSMSDQIVVMQQGRIEQIGAPERIYYEPRSTFVGDFIGEPNLLEGTVRTVDGDGRGTVFVPTLDQELCFAEAPAEGAAARWQAGQPVWVLLRSESLSLQDAPGASFAATLVERSFLGASTRFFLEGPHGGAPLIVDRRSEQRGGLQVGAQLRVAYDAADVVLFPREA